MTADVIERAALKYGMPMSPLSLIDLIGPRTAFDGGRIVWQSFPQRMTPSPLLPAIVKRKIMGVVGGKGFYSYDQNGDKIGNQLTPEVEELVKRYETKSLFQADESTESCVTTISELFAAAMCWEAIAIQRDQVADADAINAAMRGGLAWNPGNDNQDVVAYLSAERLQELAEQYPSIKSIQSVS